MVVLFIARGRGRLFPLINGDSGADCYFEVGTASCAAFAGAPKLSRRPPKAMEQSANHAHPRAKPPSTSVSQCTPSITLVQAMPVARPTASPAATALTLRERPRPISRANAARQAAAATAWPDGNDGPLNPVNWSKLGRARSIIDLVMLAMRNWPPTIKVRKANTAAVRRRIVSTIATISASGTITNAPPSWV